MPPFAPRDLPPLPAQMQYPATGLDQAGRPVKGVSSITFEPALRYLEMCARRRAQAELPTGLPAAEQARRLECAQTTVLQQLVERLNAALPDLRQAVAVSDLLSKGHRFSLEFSVYVHHLCWELSEDPLFHLHKLGGRSCWSS